MEKFLGTLLTILLIIYALKFIVRLIFPWLLKRFVTRMQNKANEQFSSMFGGQFYTQDQSESYQNQYADDNEPQITISKPHKPQKEKPSSYSELDGQYVDYEEIK
ncbi:MAG: DUF4834 family protein [Bacteroidia bacterium]|nr:DUF4834 family protein [Bacteroidia bacterium]